ncbi:hypothetical protein PE36_02889 [Moritella sp. PE36]|nr:hypothetical protein PE36_02889 [Moritella sp. PE36]
MINYPINCNSVNQRLVVMTSAIQRRVNTLLNNKDIFFDVGSGCILYFFVVDYYSLALLVSNVIT